LIMDVAVCVVTDYSIVLEILMCALTCSSLLVNCVMIIAQIINGYENWLSKKIKSWMMHYRLKKKCALDKRDSIGIAESRMKIGEQEKVEDLEKVQHIDIVGNIFDQRPEEPPRSESGSGTEAERDFF
jgi:hypothetical protein